MCNGCKPGCPFRRSQQSLAPSDTQCSANVSTDTLDGVVDWPRHKTHVAVSLASVLCFVDGQSSRLGRTRCPKGINFTVCSGTLHGLGLPLSATRCETSGAPSFGIVYVKRVSCIWHDRVCWIPASAATMSPACLFTRPFGVVYTGCLEFGCLCIIPISKVSRCLKTKHFRPKLQRWLRLKVEPEAPVVFLPSAFSATGIGP